MHFLSGNTPITRIARKFGMEIVAGAVDADAYLNLQPTLLETHETKLTFV
jgi:hypothetical protein